MTSGADRSQGYDSYDDYRVSHIAALQSPIPQLEPRVSGAFTMDTNISGMGNNAPSDGPAAFLSQPFSAATEMILKRLRGEGGLVNHDLTSGLAASNNIPGYEDVRRSVMNSMRTSSAFAVSTPAPSPSVLGKKSRLAGRASGSATPSASVKKAGGAGGGRGKKRKRKQEDTEEEEEESDSLSDMGESDSSLSEDDEASTPAAYPAVTQSGRKVVRPSQFVPDSASKAKGKQGKGKKGGAKKVKDEMCMRCGRGHSPKTNMIVFCDGCDKGWHQMCHDPMIRDEVVRTEGTEWFCSECTEKRNKKQKEKAEAEARKRSQNSTPVAQKPEPKKWEEMTVSEQRQHLSSMPHYHLVDLLIDAKTLFPSIPITPLSTSSSRYLNGRVDDRRTNIHRQQPFPPSAAQGLFSRADANPSGQLNYIRKVPPGSTLPMSNAAMSRQNSGTPRPRSAGPVAPSGFGIYNTFQQPSYPNSTSNNADLDAPGEPDTTFTTNGQAQQQQKPQVDGAEEDEEDDSPPPSPPYPKPGNGLMSRLKSDEEDLEWLVGSEREGEAFSHLVFEQSQGDGQNNPGNNLGGGMHGGMQGGEMDGMSGGGFVMS